MRDQKFAFAWHILELLLVLSLIGVLWSALHMRKPRLMETKWPAR